VVPALRVSLFLIELAVGRAFGTVLARRGCVGDSGEGSTRASRADPHDFLDLGLTATLLPQLENGPTIEYESGAADVLSCHRAGLAGLLSSFSISAYHGWMALIGAHEERRSRNAAKEHTNPG
jgi:hypothetical protein